MLSVFVFCCVENECVISCTYKTQHKRLCTTHARATTHATTSLNNKHRRAAREKKRTTRSFSFCFGRVLVCLSTKLCEREKKQLEKIVSKSIRVWSSTTTLRHIMLSARFHASALRGGKSSEDDPGPRCGHTLTALQWDGVHRLVAFGGATALENSSASTTTGTTTDKIDSDVNTNGVKSTTTKNGTSSSGVRLAGATNDVHVFDVKSGTWQKLYPSGDPPSARAAHASANVGGMLVVHGGIGPSGLSGPDLHVLDLANYHHHHANTNDEENNNNNNNTGATTTTSKPAKELKWQRVAVAGEGPVPRYAHSLAFVAGRYLVCCCGNDGSKCLDDGWVLDTAAKPYAWKKLEATGDVPSPRMYASACARSDGLLLLTGGRNAKGEAVADARGLARHRDGTWEWAAAPGQAPCARYQHASAFVEARLHVIGGTSGGGTTVPEDCAVSTLDTSASGRAGWRKITNGGDEEFDALNDAKRCRHATAAVGPLLITYGGLRGSELLGDVVIAEEPPELSGKSRESDADSNGGISSPGSPGSSNGSGSSIRARELRLHIDHRSPSWARWLADVKLTREVAGPNANNSPFALNNNQPSHMMNASDEEDAEEYMRNREGVLRVAGRTLSSEDLRDLAAKENATDVITAFGSPAEVPGGFQGRANRESDNDGNTDSPGSPDQVMNESAQLRLATNATAEAAAAMELVSQRRLQSFAANGSDQDSPTDSRDSKGSLRTPQNRRMTPGSNPRLRDSSVRLHHRAVVVAAMGDSGGPFSSSGNGGSGGYNGSFGNHASSGGGGGIDSAGGGSNSKRLGSLVRQLSIDQFENEARRIGTPEFGNVGANSPGYTNGSTPQRFAREQRASNLGHVPAHKTVLSALLNPTSWEAPPNRAFFMNAAQIDELCDAAEAIFKKENTVLRVNAPVKIFGDLHGQFYDLMRLFAEYGSPSTAGDIAYIDYLFLGDYVDRGAHSLETIALLLALKIEHPENVHLLRGNHEEADINALFGFRIECVERLGERVGEHAWRRFNSLFEWLPLAAVIEDKVCCMHGGIGRSIETIEQIEQLERPCSMESGGVELMDLLWSDPTENDSVEGLRPNARGPGLVTFGPDRVKQFCENNGLQMLVRAHECVMDGFERFAQGQLLTLFSATNYCGTANNAGAILVLGRDLTLYPKLIHPLPPEAMDSASPGDFDHALWMQEINRERPPTPPRKNNFFGN